VAFNYWKDQYIQLVTQKVAHVHIFKYQSINNSISKERGMYQEAIHWTVRQRTLDYIYIHVNSKLLTKNVIIKVLQIYGTTLSFFHNQKKAN
jgi:hypothetical protein